MLGVPVEIRIAKVHLESRQDHTGKEQRQNMVISQSFVCSYLAVRMDPNKPFSDGNA